MQIDNELSISTDTVFSTTSIHLLGVRAAEERLQLEDAAPRDAVAPQLLVASHLLLDSHGLRREGKPALLLQQLEDARFEIDLGMGVGGGIFTGQISNLSSTK